jgi:hypothetical protein
MRAVSVTSAPYVGRSVRGVAFVGGGDTCQETVDVIGQVLRGFPVEVCEGHPQLAVQQRGRRIGRIVIESTPERDRSLRERRPPHVLGHLLDFGADCPLYRSQSITFLDQI